MAETLLPRQKTAVRRLRLPMPLRSQVQPVKSSRRRVRPPRGKNQGRLREFTQQAPRIRCVCADVCGPSAGARSAGTTSANFPPRRPDDNECSGATETVRLLSALRSFSASFPLEKQGRLTPRRKTSPLAVLSGCGREGLLGEAGPGIDGAQAVEGSVKPHNRRTSDQSQDPGV